MILQGKKNKKKKIQVKARGTSHITQFIRKQSSLFEIIC